MRAYQRAPATCSRGGCLLDMLPSLKPSRRRRACPTPQAMSTALSLEDELWQRPAAMVGPLHPPTSLHPPPSIIAQLPNPMQPQLLAAQLDAQHGHSDRDSRDHQQRAEQQHAVTASKPSAKHGVHRRARGMDLTGAWHAPTAAQGFLTRQITSAGSCSELLSIVQGNQSRLNIIHLTTALTRTAKLFKLPGLKPLDARIGSSQLVPLLVDALRNQQQLLSARCIANTLHALGSLDVRDREVYMELCGVAERHMQDFTPQGLANMLWACAQSGCPPPPRWMELFLSVLHSKLQNLSSQDVAMVMWALAKLKYRLAEVRQQEMLVAAEAQLPECSPQALTMISYALATTDQHPGAEWLALFEAAMLHQPGLVRFTPHGLSTSLWSLASLGHHPSPQLTNAICQHLTDARLQKFKGIDVATTLHAVARMHMQLTAPAHMALRRQLHKCLYDLEPMQLANAGLALAQLQQLHPGHPPIHQPTILKLLTAAYTKLMTYNSHDLSMLVQALARLRCQLPSSFLTALQQRIEHVGMEFTPQDIALTLWGLQRVGGSPSPDLMAVFFVATGQRLSSFKPQELAIMIWALAQAQFQPDKQWTAEFLHCTFPRLNQFTPQGLAHVIVALAQLSIKPTPAWLVAFVNSAGPMLPTCKRQDILEMIQGLTFFVQPPDGYQLAKVDEFMEHAQAVLDVMPATHSSPAQGLTTAPDELTGGLQRDMSHIVVATPSAASEALPLSHSMPDGAPLNGHMVAGALGMGAGAMAVSLANGMARSAPSKNSKKRQRDQQRRSSSRPSSSSKQDVEPTAAARDALQPHHQQSIQQGRQQGTGAQRQGHAVKTGAGTHVVTAAADARHKMPQQVQVRKQHKAAAVKVAKAAEAGLVRHQQAHLLVHSHDLHTAAAAAAATAASA